MPLSGPSSVKAALARPGARLLVRGVNWLGDAVMSTPALMRLREAYPQAHITLVTQAKLVDLWTYHPALDAVECFTPQDTLWQLARRLRQGRFALSLILPNSPRSALESFLARIPQRIGYANGWRRFLLTVPVAQRPDAVPMRKRPLDEIKALTAGNATARPCEPILPTAHHLFQYLTLAGAAGASPDLLAPTIRIADQEVALALARYGIAPSQPGTPLLGLNAGAEYGAAKRWPKERFIAAAQEIQSRTGCRWIVFGGPADVALASEIAACIQAKVSDPKNAVFNVAGKTTLRELCALLKACPVVLTNDTGPMHVAAAVGSTVVVPFGSTSPPLTGPGLPSGERHALLQTDVPCAPCFLRECPIDFRCMESIRVSDVVRAVLAKLPPR